LFYCHTLVRSDVDGVFSGMQSYRADELSYNARTDGCLAGFSGF